MTRTYTVLVVDDDPSIRLLCRVNLELDGHAVLEAGTLEEARTLLGTDTIDLLLLDVHVGQGDGVAFLEELRGARPQLPVAMLTGSVDSGRLGTDHDVAVIGKPFTLEELRATVERLGARVDSRA